MNTFVFPLDSAEATLDKVGGKGANLSRMSRAGFPVPPGFFITTDAYRAFVEANHLQKQIVDLASHPTQTRETRSVAIRQLFAKARIPDDLIQVIHRAYADLIQVVGDLPLAVRSSATAEDLPSASFAGQQESYLNVRGEQAILDAVRRCWSSLWTARALEYRARQRIEPSSVSLAVVAQVMVPAEASGIMFTANPINGARDEIVLDASWGLGEAIVGGLTTPDHIIVDKVTGQIKQIVIGDKSMITVPTASGTEEREAQEDKRRAQVLNAVQITKLVKLGTAIESVYGVPQDIEWCLVNDTFSIVQARPITTLARASETDFSAQKPQSVDWQVPNPKGLYVRKGVIELLPDPVSPLFATLGVPTWSRVTGSKVRQVPGGDFMSALGLTTINGYVYYDYSLLQGIRPSILIRIVPGLNFVLQTAIQRWEQEAHPAYIAIVDRWRAQDIQTLPASHLLDGAREIVNQAADYYLTIQCGILPAVYISEALFTLVYDRLIKRRNDPPASTFLMGYDSAPIRSEKSLYNLAQWARAQVDLPRTLLNMSTTDFAEARGEKNIKGVDQYIWMSFRQRFSAHLAKFGHAIYDLDFAKAVPANDPATLLEPLKFFLKDEAVDPCARQEVTVIAREQAVEMTLTRLRGMRLRLFQPLLRWAQRLAPLREDALADVGLGWPVLRSILREIGRRLVQAHAIDRPDDIFWLTLDELQIATRLLDNKQSPTKYQTITDERRASWRHQSTLTPPVKLPIKGGAYFLGVDWSRFAPAKTGQRDSQLIKGVGASMGRVSGLARVIRGPEEFNQMRPGDILVARITTPAWTPLFALAAGVVTDVGGPLSHSSIVAREYRIPAVLGTGVATERLRSGQHVTIDGDAGTVTISNTVNERTPEG